MKENFLRPPRTAGEWTADLLRAAGVVSVVLAAVGWSLTDAGILAFALPALMAPRFIGVRPWFDILYCVTALTAAWSNVFDLYTTLVGWDLIVHYTLTGLTAVLLYLVFARAEAVTPPPMRRFAVIVLTIMMGLALSALWEMVEWAGWKFIDDAIFVAYQDSIGDMAAGGLGALFAGALLVAVPVLRPDADRRVTAPSRG